MFAFPGTDAYAVQTNAADGDASPWASAAPRVPPALDRLAARRWTAVRQVHGARVLVVGAPGGPLEEEADAIVSSAPDAALAVLGADCALVGFASPEGVVGVAHAGWRGLVAGVLEATVGSMRALGASSLDAVLGACIHAECYEFGAADLDLVAERLGGEVRSATAAGRPALDLVAGVRLALARAGVEPPLELAPCTACSAGYYSFRARRDAERQALAIWRGPGGGR